MKSKKTKNVLDPFYFLISKFKTMIKDSLSPKNRLYNKTNKYRNLEIQQDIKNFFFEVATLFIFFGILLIVALIKIK